MRILTISLLSACALGAFALAGGALADDTNSSTPASAPSFGFDPNSPYQLNLLYTGEEWDNEKGGLRQGSVYMNNIDARLNVDTDKAFGWTGGRFVIEGWYENPTSLYNKFTGTADYQSPIETGLDKSTYRLYQVYYDQNLGNTDLLFGIYDLETEFSQTKPMSLFLSKNLTWTTDHDNSGTAAENRDVGPGNYPWTPLAFRVREKLDSDWSVQVAVADAVADNPHDPAQNGIYFSPKYGLMGIGEVDYIPSKYTKIMLGTWGYTSELPNNDKSYSVWGQEGAYVGGATRLYTPDTMVKKRGLDGFMTFGFCTPNSTNVYQALNGGLVYTGLLDARPNDKVGISFNINASPGSYQRGQIELGNAVDNYENSFEATYRAKINDWVTVQPDIQYITNPDFNPAVKNELVAGLHFEIGHLFGL